MKFVVPAPAKFTAVSLDSQLFSDESIDEINSQIINPVDNKIHLYAAGGETICFKLLIKPAQAGEIDIKFAPLNSVSADKTKPPLSVRWRIYKILSIPIGNYDAFFARLADSSILKPRTFPDPLIEIKPAGRGEFKIQAEDTSPILILAELTVPKKQTSADYSGAVTISSFGKYSSRELILHKFSFDLPESDITIFGLLDAATLWRHYGIGTLRDPNKLILPPDLSQVNQLADIIGSITKIADEHGLEIWLSNVYPRITHNEFDWSGYQALVRTVLENSTRDRKYWLMPIDLAFPSTRHFGQPDSIVYQGIIDKLAREFNKKFISKAAMGKALACLYWPETYPQARDEYDNYVAAAKDIFKTEQPIAIIDPFTSVNFKPFGWDNFKPFDKLEKYIAGYCPLELWLDTDSIVKFHKAGRFVFWRPDSKWGTFPGAKIFYPPYLIRSGGWLCKRYATDGIVLGKINDWPKDKAGIDTYKSSANVLVYPSDWFDTTTVVGSLKLKLLHRSIQDVRYLRKLKEIGEGELADWLSRHLIRYAYTDAFDGSIWSLRNDGICNNPRAWRLAKLIAGYTIEKHSLDKQKVKRKVRTESENISEMLKTLTTQFRQATEGITVELEGVKLKNVLDSSTGKQNTKLTCYMTARNFSDKRMKGSIEFGEKPKSYKAIRDKVSLGNLSWAWPTEGRLELITPAFGFGVFGVNYLPIIFKSDGGVKQYLNCRYCALAASRLDFPIRIDGDFSDWPDMPFAGDFRRICSDGLNARKNPDNARAAVWKTQVKIGYDKQNLYLAFICDQPADALRMKYSNTISVSDGYPWGEDLVGIFIDPDNTGALDPMKVYHIIVKANGTVIAMRGTDEAYRQGASKPWANQISAAVSVYKNAWQAEVRIPFDNLSKTDKSDKWWGMDFIRVSAAIGEISSWSGTSGQFGKPISLGNVFIDR